MERFEVFTQELCAQRDVRVDPQGPWEQQFTIDLPSNVMHSFVGSHNAVRLESDCLWRSPSVAIVLPKLSRRRPPTGFAAEAQPAVSVSLCRDDGVYEGGCELTAKWRISRVTLDSLAAIETSVLWYTEGKGDYRSARPSLSAIGRGTDSAVGPGR